MPSPRRVAWTLAGRSRHHRDRAKVQAFSFEIAPVRARPGPTGSQPLGRARSAMERRPAGLPSTMATSAARSIALRVRRLGRSYPSPSVDPVRSPKKQIRRRSRGRPAIAPHLEVRTPSKDHQKRCLDSMAAKVWTGNPNIRRRAGFDGVVAVIARSPWHAFRNPRNEDRGRPVSRQSGARPPLARR